MPGIPTWPGPDTLAAVVGMSLLVIGFGAAAILSGLAFRRDYRARRFGWCVVDCLLSLYCLAMVVTFPGFH